MAFKNIAKMIHKANEEKDPAVEFLYMLNEATKKLSNEDSEYQGGVYRPSSLGGCLRKQYFQVEDEVRDTGNEASPELIGMAQSGTDRHDRIQNTVQKMKDLKMDVEWIDPMDWIKRRKPKGTRIVRREGNEVRFYNSVLNLHFKCDGIIKFKNVYYILEIKTEVSFKYRGRVEPAPKHIKQASAYSLGIGVDKIMFLYENRDMLQKKPFIQQITDEQRGEVIHEIESIETYRRMKKIPPKTTVANDCTYCDFKTLCKRVGDTEEL